MIRRVLLFFVVAVAFVGLMAAPAHAQYSPGPITITPAQPTPGGEFTVTGCCFAPGSTVTVASDGVTLGTMIAGADGSVSGRFRASSAPGSHVLTLSGINALDGTALVLSSTVQVVAAAAGSSPNLPTTGSSNTINYTGIAAVAIAGGGLLLLAGRSRRNSHS